MERLLLLAALLLWTLSSAENCKFTYTRQPVQQLPCIPVNQSLEVECEVRGPKDAIFKLKWQILDTSNGTRDDEGTNISTVQGDFRVTKTTLVVDTVAMIAEVFCEVKVEGTNDETTVVSDVLNLRNSSLLPNCIASESISLVNTTSTCIEVSLHEVTPTTTPTIPSMDLSQQVLYGVGALVLVFAVLIVLLSVGIVLMLRRKCAKKRTKGLSRQSLDDRDSLPTHPGFTNRLNTEKKNLSVTFSDSIDDSKVSPLPPLLSGHSHKTCPSVPCPPTPDESTTKLDLVCEPTSHLLDIYRTLREGGEEMGEAGSEQDDEGAEKATPPSVTWAGPLHAGVCNPNYTSMPPQTSAAEEHDVMGLDVADSAYVRSRYEWSDPMVEATSGPEEVGGDKYRGNYERDPLYMARQRHTYANCGYENSVPPAGVSPVSPAERTDKYRGDYERSETYVFPPVTSSTVSPSVVPASSHAQSHSSSQTHQSGTSVTQAGIGTGKYRGNYERSQIYVQHLLKTEMALPSNHNHHTEHVQLVHTNSS